MTAVFGPPWDAPAYDSALAARLNEHRAKQGHGPLFPPPQAAAH